MSDESACTEGINKTKLGVLPVTNLGEEVMLFVTSRPVCVPAHHRWRQPKSRGLFRSKHREGISAASNDFNRAGQYLADVQL